jgi:LysR family transcriptional regulator, carnitine catabolism transcriptional activator
MPSLHSAKPSTPAQLGPPASQLLQRLSLRQLRAFVAVARTGSMTQAALWMHLTPSALSMLVKSLEQELEIQLFERNTRRLTLTEPAQTLLPVVQALLAGLEISIEQLRSQSKQGAQRLSVATSPLMAASLLPDLIASFRHAQPEVQIQLIDTAVDAVARLVRNAQADLGICTLDHDCSDLKITALMQDSLMLACHPSHPLVKLAASQGDAVAWRQLLGTRMVLLSKGSGLRQLVEQTLNKLPAQERKLALAAAQPLAAQASYEVAHVATAVGLVRAGEGIAALPAYALQRALAEQASSLAVLPLVQPVVKRKIVALSARERPLPPAAARFLAHVKLKLR